MSSERVYVVTVTNVEEHENVRVYRDRAEAEAFAAAYIPGWGCCEIEEWTVGRPDVEYDGPYWIGEWRDHFRDIGTSLRPEIERYGGGDAFKYREQWHSGEELPDATVVECVSGVAEGDNAYHRNHPYVVVHGLDRAAVEAQLHFTVAMVKDARAGAAVGR